MLPIFKKKKRVLPGFGLSMGYTITWLSLIVLIPIIFLALKPLNMGFERFVKVVTDPQVVASYVTSFSTALFASLLSVVFGFILAWVLVRYDFPGKKIFDALVDIPFALPTAVAGISFATLFSANGFFGEPLQALGLSLVNNWAGITIALTFIGFPFVVRTLQPVLREVDEQIEEAAANLGASRWQIFYRIIFPSTLPALLTGFTLALARTIGEYGSVIFIAGNMPYNTEITPLLIMIKLEQFDYEGAAAIALVLLGMSFSLLLLLNGLQSWKKINRAQA